MQSAAQLRRAEWRAHWPLVLASFMGIALPTSAYYATGLFIDPLTAQFGWNRTTISSGASIAGLIIIVLSPFVGAMVDRWGARRLVLPGLVLTMVAMAGFGLASGSAAQWLLLWGFYAIPTSALKSTLWTSAIAGRFDAARSFALAVALSGTALPTAIVPPLARWLIDTLGWREAWGALGLILGLPALVLCLFFLFDRHDDARRERSAPGGRAPTTLHLDLPGLSLSEAVRSVPLWRIALATLITMLLASTLVLHKVPLLIEVGLSRTEAAWLAGFSGLAAFAGSLVVGWLIDRYDAGLIGFITNSITAVALVFLLEAFRTPALIVISMVIVGFAGGAKLELCAYLTSKYAGLRNYGKVFSVMAGIIAATGSVGSMVGGLAYDYAGSYDLLIEVCIPASVVSALLIFRMGPYPDWGAAPPVRVAEQRPLPAAGWEGAELPSKSG